MESLTQLLFAPTLPGIPAATKSLPAHWRATYHGVGTPFSIELLLIVRRNPRIGRVLKVCLQVGTSMSIDKTIRRITPQQQQLETYRYWQSLPIGDRLSAVWEASEAAYSFAAGFKGGPANDVHRAQRPVTRIQRSRR
jgi:hypothetical protein